MKIASISALPSAYSSRNFGWFLRFMDPPLSANKPNKPIQNFAPHTAPVKARFYEMSAALHSPPNTRAGTEAVKMAGRIEF